MSSFQLNGIVGGKCAIAVAPRRTILLQQIVIDVQNRQSLILKDLNFEFDNDAFAIKIEAPPSPGIFIAGGGSGELTPNRVLFRNNTGDGVRIFFLVSAINRARNTRSLSRSDSWHMTLLRR
ncbi:hypothetical protein [Cohnella luojiensis]|uniref:Uncharacterized protein n=1 Tax=Cohnella luojiensis TaxID=652876 RepID=A0A4Y8LV54_9BACL|nr:hypothetical protein [Cohnella luojiensis]TFE25522.1 hypothetical protein E2980_13080 [Cohnella luojiensis]